MSVPKIYQNEVDIYNRKIKNISWNTSEDSGDEI